MSRHMSIHMSMHISMHISMRISMHMSMHMSIHMSIHMSMHMSMHISIHMSMYMFKHMSTHSSILYTHVQTQVSAMWAELTVLRQDKHVLSNKLKRHDDMQLELERLKQTNAQLHADNRRFLHDTQLALRAIARPRTAAAASASAMADVALRTAATTADAPVDCGEEQADGEEAGSKQHVGGGRDTPLAEKNS